MLRASMCRRCAAFFPRKDGLALLGKDPLTRGFSSLLLPEVQLQALNPARHRIAGSAAAEAHAALPDGVRGAFAQIRQGTGDAAAA